jgi:hypothetical protein
MGKTTFAKKYFPNILHLEADMLFMRNGVCYFDESALSKNHKAIEDMFRIAVDREADVVVSNTFIRLWELNKYLEYLAGTHYVVQVFRMTTRYGSVHNIPEETLERMAKTIEDFKGEVFV